jgi:hypothetical protein
MNKKIPIKVIPQLKQTLLAVVKNSLGSTMFKNYYADINGSIKDVTENGNLSCAFYVSSVLTIFALIDRHHGTVDGTVFDMLANGWKEIKRPKIGAVIVWEPVDFGLGTKHKHMGFYLGGGIAVSNHYQKGYPVKHNWTFDGSRKIEKILWHKKIK